MIKDFHEHDRAKEATGRFIGVCCFHECTANCRLTGRPVSMNRPSRIRGELPHDKCAALLTISQLESLSRKHGELPNDCPLSLDAVRAYSVLSRGELQHDCRIRRRAVQRRMTAQDFMR